MSEPEPRPLRLAFVGGGGQSAIGPVHRRAAVLDGRFEIVAGVLSSDPERSRSEGRRLGLAPDRAYGSVPEMLAAEAGRADGIDAVAIVTPNDSHHAHAMAALAAGRDVICDKPLTNTAAESVEIARMAEKRDRIVCVTYNYSGYPMIRQARAMVAAGEVGEVRSVQLEYLGSALAARVEDLPDAHRRWRLDAARSGPSLVLGDIGSHAYQMACFVLGSAPDALSAEVATLMPGRLVHDYASLRLRWASGARGTMVLSHAAAGQQNHIALRVVGARGSLEWRHRDQGQLLFSPIEGPPMLLARGQVGLSDLAKRSARVQRTGFPEGMHEAFANLYREAADAIQARRRGAPLSESVFPTAWDGALGARFVAAAVQSSAADGRWTGCGLEDG